MSKRLIIECLVKGEGKKKIPLDVDFSSGVAQPVRATSAGATPISDPASLSADPQTFAGVTNFSKTINTAQGADIASATGAGTLNLDTATGNLVDVTGTTTITAITLSQGRFRVVRFTGALILTHGASLVLPGAANITTVAGDVAVFEGYASSVVRCVSYTRAASPPMKVIDWTPFTPTVTLVGGAGNTTPVYSTNTGRYARVGTTVFVSVLLTGDGGAEGAGTGVLNVALPVAVAAQLGATVIQVGRLINNTLIAILYGTLAAAGTTVALSYFNAIGTNANITGAEQNNATRTIQLHFSYEVDG